MQAEDTAEVYEAYMPAHVREGRPHPDVIVETASLASVQPPAVTYQHHLQVGRCSAGPRTADRLGSLAWLSGVPTERVAGPCCGWVMAQGYVSYWRRMQRMLLRCSPP